MSEVEGEIGREHDDEKTRRDEKKGMEMEKM